MKCMRCGEEMRNTIGGCYTCDNCGFGVNDLVLRCETKNGKTAKEINVFDTKDLVGTGVITDVIINGESFAKGEVWDKTTTVETDEGLRNKIKDLEKQLAEKDKEIEELRNEFIQEKEFLNKQYDRCDKARKKSVEQLKEVRHQVCEEIREKFLKLEPWCFEEPQYFDFNAKKIIDILDQIEQGESK